MTEIQFIEGLRARNIDTLEQFIKYYQQRVYTIALSFVKNESEAEEIVQDVFIRIWDSIEKFKGESTLATWVYRITVSKSLDLIKSKKTRKRFAFITSLTTHSGQTPIDPPDWVHPGILAENKEQATYLYRAINDLPEHQKTAFTLSKIDQLSQKEIAEIMQLKEGAIESLLQRAKQNLRKSLINIYEELK